MHDHDHGHSSKKAVFEDVTKKMLTAVCAALVLFILERVMHAMSRDTNKDGGDVNKVGQEADKAEAAKENEASEKQADEVC